ncbi:MAG TPA: IPT/TIG domain-containing protein [Candidatus Obscuribacterales bacterium]
MNKVTAFAPALFSLFLSIAAISPVWAADGNVITLQESQKYVADSPKIQRISDSIVLKKGQEKLNLTLTYYNGSATEPSFKWLRIASPNMRYVSEADFQGQKSLSLDVTGELAFGGNQILITAEGPKGATFKWSLTTPYPTITQVTPSRIEPGQAVTILGNNFSPDPPANDVYFGEHEAECLSASPNKLIVRVPDYVECGETSLRVSVAGIDAGRLAVVAAVTTPVLKSLSRSWVPPGAQLTIYGDNFSANAADNVVYIGPLRAEVVSSSVNSITVIAPVDFGGEPWGFYQPVNVTVRGVPARNRLSVSVSQVG